MCALKTFWNRQTLREMSLTWLPNVFWRPYLSKYQTNTYEVVSRAYILTNNTGWVWIYLNKINGLEARAGYGNTDIVQLFFKGGQPGFRGSQNDNTNKYSFFMIVIISLWTTIGPRICDKVKRNGLIIYSSVPGVFHGKDCKVML